MQGVLAECIGAGHVVQRPASAGPPRCWPAECVSVQRSSEILLGVEPGLSSESPARVASPAGRLECVLGRDAQAKHGLFLSIFLFVSL